jgi:hypothetical protein
VGVLFEEEFTRFVMEKGYPGGRVVQPVAGPLENALNIDTVSLAHILPDLVCDTVLRRAALWFRHAVGVHAVKVAQDPATGLGSHGDIDIIPGTKAKLERASPDIHISNVSEERHCLIE